MSPQSWIEPYQLEPLLDSNPCGITPMALGVGMTALIESATGPLVHITRAGEGTELRLPGSPSFRVVGSHGVSGAHTAIILSPSNQAEQYRHYGETVRLGASGSIRISFGDEHYDLEARGHSPLRGPTRHTRRVRPGMLCLGFSSSLPVLLRIGRALDLPLARPLPRLGGYHVIKGSLASSPGETVLSHPKLRLVVNNVREIAPASPEPRQRAANPAALGWSLGRPRPPRYREVLGALNGLRSTRSRNASRNDRWVACGSS